MTDKSDYESQLRRSTRADQELLSTVNLWRAVLSQACRDLVSPYKATVESIVEWLDHEEDVQMVCDFADVDYEQFIKRVRELLTMPLAYRQEQLLGIAKVLYRQAGKLSQENDTFFTQMASGASQTPGAKYTGGPRPPRGSRDDRRIPPARKATGRSRGNRRKRA